MTPASILSDLRRRGVGVLVTKDRVRLRIPRGTIVPESLIAAAREQRDRIRALLEQDVGDRFDERAAVIQHDGQLTREQADVLAGLCTMPAPAGVTADQVRTVIDAAALFLERRLGADAGRS